MWKPVGGRLRGVAVGMILGFAVTWAQDDTARPDSSEAPPVMAEVDEMADLEPPEPVAPEEAPAGDHDRDTGQHRREIVRVFGGATVGEGENVSDLVVVFGPAVMKGHVHGDMVVVWGRVEVDGPVDGSLVAPFSPVRLGPRARIGNEFVSVGAEVDMDPGARIDGQRIVVSIEQLMEEMPFLRPLESMLVGIKDWAVFGLMLGRPLPHQWGWWWYVAVACAGLYLLMGLMFPKPLAVVVEAMETQPVASFFLGVLGFIVACLLGLILAATGIGLLVFPFLGLAVLVLLLCGSVAVHQSIGGRLGRQFGLDPTVQPVLALVLGLVLVYALYVVPVLGFLLWGLLMPLAFGGALQGLMTSFRRRRLETAPVAAYAAAGVGSGGTTRAWAAPGAGPEEVPPVIDPGLRAPTATELVGMPRAGFWIRVAATFLDLLVVCVVLAMLGLMEYFLFPWIAYHVGMWAWKGTTVGGVVFGLRVVRRDGGPMTVAVALVRSLAAVLSGLALFLGFFWVGWTRERLAWHDVIAGTAILRGPRGMPLV